MLGFHNLLGKPGPLIHYSAINFFSEMRSNFTEANRLLSGTNDRWTDAVNSASKRKDLMLMLMLQDLKRPLYYRKSVNLGMKSQKQLIENGLHGTVRQNPEVQLNSIMDTTFCLVFAQRLLKQSYGAQGNHHCQ